MLLVVNIILLIHWIEFTNLLIHFLGLYLNRRDGY